MNDLSTIKRLNDKYAAKFGKAAALAEKREAQQAKTKRVMQSQARAKGTKI